MKKLLLIAFSCFIILSCSDDDLPSDKDDISIPGRTIYIAGYISDGISETACYWVDGKNMNYLAVQKQMVLLLKMAKYMYLVDLIVDLATGKMEKKLI